MEKIDTILFPDESYQIRTMVAVVLLGFVKETTKKSLHTESTSSCKILGRIWTMKNEIILCIEKKPFDANLFIFFFNKYLCNYPEAGKLLWY